MRGYRKTPNTNTPNIVALSLLSVLSLVFTSLAGVRADNLFPLGQGNVLNNVLGAGTGVLRTTSSTVQSTVNGLGAPVNTLAPGAVPSSIGTVITSPINPVINAVTTPVSNIASPVINSISSPINNITGSSLLSPMSTITNLGTGTIGTLTNSLPASSHRMPASASSSNIPNINNRNSAVPIAATALSNHVQVWTRPDASKLRGVSVLNTGINELPTAQKLPNIHSDPGSIVQHNGNGTIKLDSGSMLLSVSGAKQSSLLETPIGKLWVGRRANVLVSYLDGVLRVQNMDSIGDNVRVSLNQGEQLKTMALGAGYELVASNKKLDHSLLYPADGIARRNPVLIGDRHLAVTEVNVLTVLKSQTLITALKNSSNSDRKIFDGILKTAAILDMTRGRAGFLRVAPILNGATQTVKAVGKTVTGGLSPFGGAVRNIGNELIDTVADILPGQVTVPPVPPIIPNPPGNPIPPVVPIPPTIPPIPIPPNPTPQVSNPGGPGGTNTANNSNSASTNVIASQPQTLASSLQNPSSNAIAVRNTLVPTDLTPLKFPRKSKEFVKELERKNQKKKFNLLERHARKLLDLEAGPRPKEQISSKTDESKPESVQ